MDRTQQNFVGVSSLSNMDGQEGLATIPSNFVD